MGVVACRRSRGRWRCRQRRWQNWAFRARKGEALVKRESVKPVTELEAEVTLLRQENTRLRLEKEILKKAAAYFAKESM